MKRNILFTLLVALTFAFTGCMKIAAKPVGAAPTNQRGPNYQEPGSNERDPGPIGVIDPDLFVEPEGTLGINDSLPPGGREVIFNTTGSGAEVY